MIDFFVLSRLECLMREMLTLLWGVGLGGGGGGDGGAPTCNGLLGLYHRSGKGGVGDPA